MYQKGLKLTTLITKNLQISSISDESIGKCTKAEIKQVNLHVALLYTNLLNKQLIIIPVKHVVEEFPLQNCTSYLNNVFTIDSSYL